MSRAEFTKVEAYLRRIFRNESIVVKVPRKANEPVEVWCGGEFIGTLYRDEEDGEVSYDFHMTILDFDIQAE